MCQLTCLPPVRFYAWLGWNSVSAGLLADLCDLMIVSGGLFWAVDVDSYTLVSAKVSELLLQTALSPLSGYRLVHNGMVTGWGVAQQIQHCNTSSQDIHV